MIYKHPTEIPKSDKIKGLRWTGERVPYPVNEIHGDTYPLAWGDDGEIYTSAGDPNWAFVDGKPTPLTWQEAIEMPGIYPHMGGLDIEKISGTGKCFAIKRVNSMPGLTGPGGRGPKPTGLVSVNGSLYLAVQNLLGSKPPRFGEKSQHGSDATILRSDDYGLTWSPDIQSWWPEFEAKYYSRKEWKWVNSPEDRESYNGWKPMFPGNLFGGPSFIQFGQDNSGALDDYVYAVSGDQWDNGNEMRLGRVPKGGIIDEKAWEFAVLQDDGSVQWTNKLEESKPVLIIERHLGVPEMVYFPSIGRYLLLTWGLHKDFHVEAGSELTVLESEHPWGPFKLVHYEEIWDSVKVCPYCPRIPMKWFDEKTMSGWLLHSGNWFSMDPWYRMHIKPFELLF